MKRVLFIALSLLLIACGEQERKNNLPHIPRADSSQEASQKPLNNLDTCTEQPKKRKYSDETLIGLLDSIHTLSPQRLSWAAMHPYDSVQRSFHHLNRLFSEKDFSLIEESIRNHAMVSKTVKKLFNDSYALESYGSGASDSIPVQYFLFDDRHKEKDFAIVIGNSLGEWTSNYYFFHGRKLIAKHQIFHHNEIELHSFRNEAGHTIVYYKIVFDWGSGVALFNYFFYSYQKDRLVPCLNLIREAHWVNMVPPITSFSSEIVSTAPLTVKTHYNWYILSAKYYTDPCHYNEAKEISMAAGNQTLRFHWDEPRKRYVCTNPEHGFSALDMPAYLPMAFGGAHYASELLFIQRHYTVFKSLLQNKGTQSAVLYFLDDLKGQSNPFVEVKVH